MTRPLGILILLAYALWALLPCGFVFCQTPGGHARIELAAGAGDSDCLTGGYSCGESYLERPILSHFLVISPRTGLGGSTRQADHPHCQDTPIGFAGPRLAVLTDKGPGSSCDGPAYPGVEPLTARLSLPEASLPFPGQACRAPVKPASLERSVILRR